MVEPAHLTAQGVSNKAMDLQEVRVTSGQMNEITLEINTTNKREDSTMAPAINQDNQLLIQQIVVISGQFPPDFDPGSKVKRKRIQIDNPVEMELWVCTDNKKEEGDEDKNVDKNVKRLDISPDSGYLTHLRFKSQCPFECELNGITLTKKRRKCNDQDECELNGIDLIEKRRNDKRRKCNDQEECELNGIDLIEKRRNDQDECELNEITLKEKRLA